MTVAPELLVIEERAEYRCGKTARTRKAGAATERIRTATRGQTRIRGFGTRAGEAGTALRSAARSREHPAPALRTRRSRAPAGGPARRDPRPHARRRSRGS